LAGFETERKKAYIHVPKREGTDNKTRAELGTRTGRLRHG
jgi:hypothetical protein